MIIGSYNEGDMGNPANPPSGFGAAYICEFLSEHGLYGSLIRVEAPDMAPKDFFAFFLAFLIFRFSLAVCWATFCCSRFPLSLLPLSPITVPSDSVNSGGDRNGRYAWLRDRT